MKFFFLICSILFLVNCSKPKTVLICGDHVCVNKTEAEQYFQENLSIEVKVVDKKDKNEIDLVELNLKENKNGRKKIIILSKEKTKKDLKILSNKEITQIKKDIKDKNKEKKIVRKVKIKKEKVINEDKKIIQIISKNLENDVIQTRKDIVDVCSILEKCNIDEISKYLLKLGEKKDFPDITKRQ